MLLSNSVDYTVQTNGFEGPLDLLLRLIEREELDITTVALAHVADTYLAQVRSIANPDPAQLSAFLVIAARLLLIKSRALLPRQPPAASEDHSDDADQLIRQLQEYQRYKQVAAMLRTIDDQGRRSYVRTTAPAIVLPANHNQLDVSIWQMISAVQRRMQLMLPLEPAAIPLPAPKLLTVAQVAQQIRERLKNQEWFAFEDLLSLTIQRVEVIVTLWAVLELLKRRAIIVEQPALFGAIQIGRGPTLNEVELQNLDLPTAQEGGE